MENFDRENIDELLEIHQIHQHFFLSKICHTIFSLAGIDGMPSSLIMPRPSILSKASVIIVIIVIINGLQGIGLQNLYMHNAPTNVMMC